MRILLTRKSACRHERTQAPVGEEQLVGRAGLGGLPAGVQSRGQDQQVEDDYRDQSRDLDRHDSVE
jgi:hypothetical protein